HEAIIENHISLLHQAQGAQGEQFRITGTTAYQIDFPLSEARILCLQGIGYSLVRLRRLPVQDQLCRRSLQNIFPETTPLVGIRKALFDTVPPATRQLRKSAI